MAILIGVCARLAAALSTVQMGLFLVLVWAPAVATRSLNRFEWGEVVVTWMLTAAAWLWRIHTTAPHGSLVDERVQRRCIRLHKIF